MKAPDHVNFDLDRYMDSQTDTATELFDSNGFPLMVGEKYWSINKGATIVETNPDSLHDFLDSEGAEFDEPITYDYDQLVGLLLGYYDAEVISWT